MTLVPTLILLPCQDFLDSLLMAFSIINNQERQVSMGATLHFILFLFCFTYLILSIIVFNAFFSLQFAYFSVCLLCDCMGSIG